MKGHVQLNSGILAPVEYAESNAKPDHMEIATTANGRDITKGYLEGSPLLTPDDSVLKSRGGDYKIYEEIRRDDQVKCVFDQRRTAVISKNWEVQPGDDTPKAQEAADHLEMVLNNIRFDRITYKMLSGVFYGYAVGECLWAVEDSKIVLADIKVKKQRRFAYSPQGELLLKTTSQPFGEPLPDRKFWTYSCGADDDDDPYGLGLAHWLYWPVFFKRNGIKFWLMFLEKFGQPTAMGKYPANTGRPERQALLSALQAISTDTGITIPTGMEIELLEAARQGTADYTALYDRMDGAITKVVLGHTGSSDSTPGRLGGEDNAADVRDDIVKADADLICESFNMGPARWLTDWNFGEDVAAPRVWRSLEEPEDLNSLAERDKKLYEIGYKPTLKRITDIYGPDYLPVEKPDNNTELLPGTEFAETDDTDIVDTQADRLEQDTDASMNGIIEPVKRLLDNSTSLQEFSDGLAQIYPDIDVNPLATQFQEAFAAAHLAGQTDVVDNN